MVAVFLRRSGVMYTFLPYGCAHQHGNGTLSWEEQMGREQLISEAAQLVNNQCY